MERQASLMVLVKAERVQLAGARDGEEKSHFQEWRKINKLQTKASEYV